MQAKFLIVLSFVIVLGSCSSSQGEQSPQSSNSADDGLSEAQSPSLVITPEPTPISQEEMREGAKEVSDLDAREVADAYGGTKDEWRRIYNAQYNLTGTLKEFEHIDGMMGNVEAYSKQAVDCGLRAERWRVSLIERIKHQWMMDPKYIRLYNSLSPDELLASRAYRINARNLYDGDGWRMECEDLRTIPFLKMFDMVSAGIAPYPDAARDPNP